MAPPRIWTPEQAKRWRIEYEAGASIKELAQAHNIARGTMRTALLDAGTTLRPNIKTTTHDRVVAATPLMVADYQAGMTIRQIADKYEVGRTAVRGALVRAGVVIRDRHDPIYYLKPRFVPPRAWTPEQAAEWRGEYEAGASIKGLAQVYNLARETVRTALLHAGTELRTS